MNGLDELVASLNKGQSGSVEMPAGHGKTETIVNLAVALASSSASLLILTHTNVAVEAITRRLRRACLEFPRRVTVQTIDSFCRRWSLSFPTSCGYRDRNAVECSMDFQKLEIGMLEGMRSNQHIRKLVGQCFSAVLVDEYQDCSPSQISLLIGIRDLCKVPMLVFGDGLQAIFRHKGTSGIQKSGWASTVHPEFPPIVLDAVPWRWQESNPSLGGWLSQTRSTLLTGGVVHLAPYLHEAQPSNHRYLAYAVANLCSVHDSLVLIENLYNRRVSLAKRLGIDFQLHEAKNHDEFESISREFRVGNGITITVELVKLLRKSAVNFGTLLSDDQIENLTVPRVPRFRSVDKIDLTALLTLCIETPTPDNLVALLRWFLSANSIRIFRRPLIQELIEVLGRLIVTDMPFVDAHTEHRRETKLGGGIAEPYLITSPWLYKGLEAPNVVVIRPEEMERQEFYVSTTRATHNLWVISETGVFGSS